MQRLRTMPPCTRKQEGLCCSVSCKNQDACYCSCGLYDGDSF